ncbi:MAG: enoyl-CoA hydratase [Rhodobacteraceae bacterium]|nr:enoyl-CoA hydratase [Paracoccaceae bacterium]
MADEVLQRTQDGSIHVLKLNCPERLNILSERMLDELQSALDDISRRPEIRCVILRAEGRAFCAGHDLREMTRNRQSEDGGKEYFRTIFDKCAAMMMSITQLPQPVIAQVQGSAVAAGCQLVATCDLAVAATNAEFGVNGVNIGLFCSTPMVALSRNLPRKHAFEMLTTGRLIGAEEACRVGLVNRVVQAEELEDSTAALAETVASKLDAAVRIGKRAFYEQAEMTLSDAYGFAGDVMVENMMHRDTKEGISAFLDKREPHWTQ